MQDPNVIHTTGFGASYEPIPAPDVPETEVSKPKKKVAAKPDDAEES